jgi:hypothetical protein
METTASNPAEATRYVVRMRGGFAKWSNRSKCFTQVGINQADRFDAEKATAIAAKFDGARIMEVEL